MAEGKRIKKHRIGDDNIPRFLFLGIVSAEPDYRLSVILNKKAGFDLRKSASDIIAEPGGNRGFSMFTDPSGHLTLASNRSSGSLLIRSLKNIDYLLVVHHSPALAELPELAKLIRDCPEVTAVFIFDSSKINDRALFSLVR